MLLWPAPAITTSNFSLVAGRSPGTDACAMSFREPSANGASAALFTKPRRVIFVIASSANFSESTNRSNEVEVTPAMVYLLLCHFERGEQSLFDCKNVRGDSSRRS